MKAIYIVCVIALLSAMMVAPAAATTWDVYVNETGWWRDGGAFNAVVPSLWTNVGTGAMNNVNDGDTVFVYNGTYQLTSGGLSFIEPNVTLIGEGAVTLDGVGYAFIHMGSENAGDACPGSILDGFTIVNSGVGLKTYLNSPNCIIRNCVFDGMTADSCLDIASDNTTFENNVVSNATGTYYALNAEGNSCTYVNNTFINNAGAAISLCNGVNNIVTKNNFISNAYAGIELWDAGSGNKIYLNNFVDNGVTATTSDTTAPSVTYWNSTEPITYTHGSTTHTNYLGNYWDSDYTGSDGDGDGLGDTSYVVPGGIGDDYCPLMEPFENYPEVPAAADPDLTPTSIATDSLSAGVPAAITVDVSNIGTAAAGQFNVTLKVEDTVIGNDTVTSLGAGSSVPVVFTWTPDVAGTFNLTAIADSDDAVAESDEANNGLTNEVMVMPAVADEIVWEYSAGLDYPGDADRLLTGNTLIASAENNRVIEVTSDGTTVWEYTATVLNYPYDTDRLSDSNTLICDAYNARVIEVTSDGTTVWEYNGAVATSAYRLPNGNTLITDAGSPRVIEIDLSGTIVWEFSTGIVCPLDAERLSDGNTLITDMGGGRVIEVTSGGTIVWEYNTGPSDPCDADRLSNGNTLISDTLNNRVIEVASDGTIVWEYSTGLKWPCDADRLDNGNTLISDSDNDRVIEVGTQPADPDLTPTSIATDSLSVGVPAAITVNVSNIGSAEAGSFNVTLKVEETVIGSDTVASLGAGGSVPVVFTWTPDAAGSFNLTAIADSDDAVAESDEANNGLTREVTVEEQSTPTPPTSFLISGNITYDNGNPVMNPAVTVTNLATSEDFTVKTDAGSNYYLTLTDSTHVTAGDTIRINASDGTASSETDHPVTASEIETGGFVHDMTLESGDLPDLTVTEKSEEWISLADGTYNVTCTVANIGTSGADASTTAIEIDETVVATDPVPALAIGESHTSTLGPFTLSGVNDTIRVCADSDDNISEQSETNNYLENVLEASSMPDLIVWVALKTPGYVNEDNILGVRVKNTGTEDAGSFNVSLTIDGTPMPGQTVPPLAGGETTELEYAWTPTELGGHLLSATVDINNDVEESDETNNDYARTSVIIKSTDWPQFHYDASGIGFSPSGAPSLDTVKWISGNISAGGGLSWGGFSDMGPVVAGGKIFTYCGVGGVSATTYDVACLDEETGELLWNITLPYPMKFGSWAPLGYDDGMVFCTVNHYVVALDANDGSIVWECDLDSPEFEGHAWSVNGGPTIANGKVFAGTYDEGGIGGAGGLAGYVAIDEYTGEKLWQTTGDGHCDSTPAYYDGVIYAGFDHDWTASPSGGCYALNASTGEEVWRTWLPFSVWGSVSVDEDYVYGANYNFYGPAQVFILYRNNGTVKVISESLRTDSTPAVAYDNIYICGGCTGYSDTGTFCVDKETLEVIWSAPAGSWTASPAVADGKVYVGGFCYDAFTGEEIFSYEQGGLSPVIANGYLFNVQNGSVVCFGDILENIPDLTVTEIVTPVRLRADVINPISATVENVGYENATNFVVTLEAGGSIVDTDTVTSLNTGENTTIEFLWTPSYAGEYTLNVTADANSEVIESDEANNSRIATGTVLDMLTATVNVRIEGMNDTVWTGDVTFSNSTITASNGSVHYLNEPTALGALNEADKSGGFGYVVESHPVYGLYVSEVNNEPAIVWDGWMYRVNYISPWVGSADCTLADSDDMLWYFGAWTAPPLAIELNKTAVDTGEEFAANVTAYNGTSMVFEPVDGANIYVDNVLHGLTGTNGTFTISLGVPGIYQIHADKETWANYTRSGKESVNVATSALKVDIGDYVVTEGSSIVAPITVYGIEDYGTTTLSIEYDSSVAWVTSVDGTANSTISSSNTNNPAGIVTLSAWNTNGVSGDVVIAYVTFESRGSSGSSAPLNLSVLLMKDTSYNNVPTRDEDGSLTVMEDVMPVVGSPQSSPDTILNDNGRARVPGTNLSTLSVSVTDNAGIASVTIDLSPIGGNATQPMTPAGGTIWSVVVNATAGINENHNLGVNATDTSGNSNTGVSVPLSVLRRGDVVRDNEVDILDAYYIARYSVGLEPAPDQFVADVSPADQWDGVDIVDAFYIARYDVGLEDAP